MGEGIIRSMDIKESIKYEGDFRDVRKILKEVYDLTDKSLRKFVRMREDYYCIVTLWIIGTWFHDLFVSYPYLFFNAMRGSAKSRTLKLIAALGHNGEHLASISDSAIFRSSKTTFCLDEMEGIAGKDRKDLRELLNAAYKKGIGVKRTKKIRTATGEEFITEKFDVFNPVAIANIYGMDNVLGDRCITLILERSDDPMVTRLLEIFEQDSDVQAARERLEILAKEEFSVVSVVNTIIKNIYLSWNSEVSNIYTTTQNYTNIHSTLTDREKEVLPEKATIYKILDSGITGRQLELFMPLFILAFICGEDILDRIIGIAKKIGEEKRIEDSTENRDISIIQFVSQLNPMDYSGWVSVKELFSQFKVFIDEELEERNNIKWFGRALVRLVLEKDKRRIGKGIEVKLDIPKAISKYRMFKPEVSDG